MKLPIKASCQCGQVTYTLARAPSKVAACHCTQCQKLAGAPYSLTWFVDAGDITFNGEMGEWQRTADSGNINIARFCTGCGNRIYHYNPAQPEAIKLKLKPTRHESDAVFEPSVHIWVDEKLPWVTLPEGVPAYPRTP